MVAISKRTGLTREALYKAVGEGNNPTLDSLLRIMKALGVELAVKMKEPEMPLTPHPSMFVHPGLFLRAEIIDAKGLNVADAAKHLGVTRQTFSRLLNGRQDLSAEMAVRFEKAFGAKADILMRMQVAYDLARARSSEDDIKVRP